MMIRMVTTAAGPRGVWPADRLVTVNEATGKALIDGGYAIAAGQPSEQATHLRPMPLTAIKGISMNRSAKLAQMGIVTMAQLIKAQPITVARGISGVGLAQVEKWQAQARTLSGAK